MTCKDTVANLKGIFPPVSTPFDARGKIDERRFKENVRRYVGVGLSGILVAGSTGEAPYLTDRERLRLVDLAGEFVGPPYLLIAGTGLESTGETIRLSREAVARGADAVLILTPAYYKSRMNSAALVAHFRAVADALRRPVVIYNIPQFTGIKMEPEAFVQLSRHPNIIGLKESSGDLKYLQKILQSLGEKRLRNFRVLCGAASIMLDSLRAGAAGGVLGQANFAPELCVGLYDAFQQGQIALAEKLQERLRPLVENIARPFGVAGMKAALDLCGYHGGPLRPPLAALRAAERRIVQGAVRQARAGLDL